MNKPLSVVVIDDEAPVCQLIARVLADDYAVTTYDSAEAFAAPAEPHVLVVDKNLPGLSGLDLVERHRRCGYRFEAVMITGYADMDSALRAMELGIYSYLRKPFEISELVDAVRRAAERLDQPDPGIDPDREHLRRRVHELEGKVAELSSTLSLLRRNETQLLNERLVSLGQVTASVSHELNNVITYIVGNFELLAQRLPSLLAAVETLRGGGDADDFFAEHGKLVQGAFYAELPTFVKQTTDGLMIIRQLCDDLRGLTRVTDQGAVFDLREAVRMAVRMTGGVVRRNIEFDVHEGDTQLPVRGNLGRMVQAVINLLINAAESLDPQQQRPRRIGLTLSRADRQVILTVVDTGRGIHKRFMQDIFKPFVTFKKDGTGLGLPLVQSVVEQHRGHLSFQSAVDEGTVVEIRLPLAGDDWARRSSVVGGRR